MVSTRFFIIMFWFIHLFLVIVIWNLALLYTMVDFFSSLMGKSCSGFRKVSPEINGRKTVFMWCLKFCPWAVFHDDADYTNASPFRSVCKFENIFYIKISIFWLQVEHKSWNLKSMYRNIWNIYSRDKHPQIERLMCGYIKRYCFR